MTNPDLSNMKLDGPVAINVTEETKLAWLHRMNEQPSIDCRQKSDVVVPPSTSIY